MNFFLDLWHDLREKRLWPVAVGLLAAAIAIPVVMLKPAGTPASPPAIVAESGKAETLPAVSVDSTPVHGSKLETFSARDPFKPLSDLQKEQTTDTGSNSGGGAGSGSGGGASVPDGGGSPAGGTSGGGGDTAGGDTGGGDTTPVGDPGSSSGGTEGGRKWFRYVVDVKFGEPTKQKTVKDVERLSGLPDDEQPAVTFMGVTDDGKSAVFLVIDDSLVADGEGACRDENCKVVELGIGGGDDEESFTSTDGAVQYDLTLLRIRRVEMDPPSGAGSKEPAADPGAAEKRVAGATGSAVGAVANPEALPQLLAGPDVVIADE